MGCVDQHGGQEEEQEEGQGQCYWPSEQRLGRRARGLAAALSAADCLSPAEEGGGEGGGDSVQEDTSTSPLQIVGPHLCDDAAAVLGLQGLSLSDLRECCSGSATAATATRFCLDLR